MKIIESIIVNVLESLYQSLFSAIVLSVLFMFAYLYSTDTKMRGKGWKNSVRRWLNLFRTSSKFREIFYFVLYSALILFRTLLCRNIWVRPLSDVFGGWTLYTFDSSGHGTLTTESIENILLFIPFAFMLSKLLVENNNNRMKGIVYVTNVSVCIELCQLFLRVGTFQFSDIFYNTLGGIIGVCLNMFWDKIKERIYCFLNL